MCPADDVNSLDFCFRAVPLACRGTEVATERVAGAVSHLYLSAYGISVHFWFKIEVVECLCLHLLRPMKSVHRQKESFSVRVPPLPCSHCSRVVQVPVQVTACHLCAQHVTLRPLVCLCVQKRLLSGAGRGAPRKARRVLEPFFCVLRFRALVAGSSELYQVPAPRSAFFRPPWCTRTPRTLTPIWLPCKCPALVSPGYGYP